MKLWTKLLLIHFCHVLSQYNSKIAPKLDGNPEKNFKNSKLIKLWYKPYFIVDIYLICIMITLSAQILHFLGHIKICNFGSFFLTMKWYVQTLNRVPQLIKNSKFFKNGVKSSHKPVNHIFLGNIFKNFNKPYFQNLPWNLAKMQFKLIFQVSPIPRGR